MIQIALVEDEKNYVNVLQSYLAEFEKETQTPIEFRHFSGGDELLSSDWEKWDILLLDIEMPGIDGMALARKIREINKEILIIFVTRMAQYAMAGYEVSALDYILKPVNYNAFSMKMRRAVDLINMRRPRYVTAADKNSVHKILVESIIYVEVQGHTIYYHMSGDTVSSTGSRTISSLEKELQPWGLVRCNQCYLVNMRYVRSVEKDKVILTDGESLRMSRSRKKAFMQALLQYWGH